MIVHMHGIGGDGEYFGDNDGQFDRINVFYHEASGGMYRHFSCTYHARYYSSPA
jgi:hypothetical protein